MDMLMDFGRKVEWAPFHGGNQSLRSCCISVLRLPRQATSSEWLQTTEIYPHIVLKVRSLKTRCHYGHAPSKGSRRESFFVFS